jgi:hypothetical protein
MSSIDFIEDNYFKNDANGEIKIDKELNVVSGGFLVQSEDVLKLAVTNEKVDENGIILSKKLYDKLSITMQNSTIFIIALVNRYSQNGKITKEYIKTELKIAKIVENCNDFAILGDEFIYSTFFRDYLGYNYEKYAGSAVNLSINSIENERQIRQYFYNFNVSKPFEEINMQIDGIINVLQIILAVFSIIIICISIFLLSLIIKSFLIDFREDLHVLYCNGLSKKEIGKILKNYVLNLFLKSTFVTLVFNLGISAMISFIVSKTLNTTFKFSFCYPSIIASLLISVFMILIGHAFINKFLKNEDVVISIRN